MQHKHAATYSTGKMHHQTNKFNGQRHPQHNVNQVDTVIRVDFSLDTLSPGEDEKR